MMDGWLDKLWLLLADNVVMHDVKDALRINLLFHENWFVIFKYQTCRIASLSLMP